ncbi:hypothetical protein FEP67_04374 [Burkholderia multivorans]|nr:hypothetical protein [Burkholderia multivorans]MDR8998231.1 hypothetical protein [Burkholderia multivorans]
MRALPLQPLGRAHEPAREPVELLRALLEPARQCAGKRPFALGQFAQQQRALGARELGRAGRRRRAHVGREIGDREIGFVPDAADDRQFARRNRARERFVVERPQIFDRAAAATDEQHVDLAPRVRRLHGGDELLRRARTLYGRRIHDHRDMRRATRERGQHVAQRGGLQRRDDADCARVRGQRPLALGREQPFGLELRLQPQERLVEPPLSGAPHGLDIQLHLAARLVHRDDRAHFDAVAFARHEFRVLRAAAEHHAAHLRLLILDREIPVAARRAREVRYFARDPQQRERAFEHRRNRAVQRRNGNHFVAAARCAGCGKRRVGEHGRSIECWRRHDSPTSARRPASRRAAAVHRSVHTLASAGENR